MADPDLIPIEEWCEWGEDDGCDYPASNLLITSNGDLEWYCDEHGEQRLEEVRCG